MRCAHATHYIFEGDDKYSTYQDLQNSKDFKGQIGATGGAQMHEGYLALTGNYKPGSLRDKLIESFAGTHDLLGGQIWGYYGDDGNTKRGSKLIRTIYHYV